MPDFRFLVGGTATMCVLVDAKPFVTAEDIKDVDFPKARGIPMCIPRSKFAELANSHADNLFQLAIFSCLLIPIPLCSGRWDLPPLLLDFACRRLIRTVLAEDSRLPSGHVPRRSHDTNTSRCRCRMNRDRREESPYKACVFF